MRTDDVFNDIDSKTADRLSKEYPVLDDERKERLYAMSKRKFDIKNDNNSIDVSGVEKYRRPAWYKGISIAAAAVLLIGGIGGSMYFISRNGKAPLAAVTTEETTEMTTDAEDTVTVLEEYDAKALIDDCIDFFSVINGGSLEVDKSDVVTKTSEQISGGEFRRDYYRVTDPKYPTFADIEKRCYEIFDAECGQMILKECIGEKDDNMSDPLFCVTEDGYYHESNHHDDDTNIFSSNEYEMNEYTDDSGNITATVIVRNDNTTLKTIFTIVNTEDGLRIGNIWITPIYDETEVSTEAVEADADTIAKSLIDDYREFMCALHAGDLEVDKSDIITKTMKTEDGQFEYQLEFYRVIDQRYPTWADIEKRCLEILDNELGHKVLEMCSDIDEDTKKHTFVCTTDNGYYIEKGIHDIGVETLKWEGYDLNSEFDENGNIIAAIRHTHQIESQNFTLETTFTIVNTENGWRISDVTEKPVE